MKMPPPARILPPKHSTGPLAHLTPSSQVGNPSEGASASGEGVTVGVVSSSVPGCKVAWIPAPVAPDSGVVWDESGSAQAEVRNMTSSGRNRARVRGRNADIQRLCGRRGKRHTRMRQRGADRAAEKVPEMLMVSVPCHPHMPMIGSPSLLPTVSHSVHAGYLASRYLQPL